MAENSNWCLQQRASDRITLVPLSDLIRTVQYNSKLIASAAQQKKKDKCKCVCRAVATSNTSNSIKSGVWEQPAVVRGRGLESTVAMFGGLKRLFGRMTFGKKDSGHASGGPTGAIAGAENSWDRSDLRIGSSDSLSAVAVSFSPPDSFLCDVCGMSFEDKEVFEFHNSVLCKPLSKERDSGVELEEDSSPKTKAIAGPAEKTGTGKRVKDDTGEVDCVCKHMRTDEIEDAITSEDMPITKAIGAPESDAVRSTEGQNAEMTAEKWLDSEITAQCSDPVTLKASGTEETEQMNNTPVEPVEDEECNKCRNEFPGEMNEAEKQNTILESELNETAIRLTDAEPIPPKENVPVLPKRKWFTHENIEFKNRLMMRMDGDRCCYIFGEEFKLHDIISFKVRKFKRGVFGSISFGVTKQSPHQIILKDLPVDPKELKSNRQFILADDLFRDLKLKDLKNCQKMQLKRSYTGIKFITTDDEGYFQDQLFFAMYHLTLYPFFVFDGPVSAIRLYDD